MMFANVHFVPAEHEESDSSDSEPGKFQNDYFVILAFCRTILHFFPLSYVLHVFSCAFFRWLL